jgi:SAM-dependent methyltransferase
MTRPTERFSSRVANYARYRPSYPQAAIDLLAARCGLSPTAVVADVGSGTGILTEQLLAGGAEVMAVEPNDGMRAAAAARLGARSRFHSVRGTAEATTLPSGSIDLWLAGQAFHWFEVRAARRADEASMHEFFGGAMELATFPNPQLYDFQGLMGRLMSSSYASEPGHPEHEPMLAGLRDVFRRHERNGEIVFPHRTLVYFAPLRAPGRGAQ